MTIDLHDSYGDGWGNSGVLKIYNAATSVVTNTFAFKEELEEMTYTACLPSSACYYGKTKGGISSEMSWDILAGTVWGETERRKD